MTDDPIIVTVDEEILDLVPAFLENRRKDVDTAEKALARGDFQEIRDLGHTLKGNGGGYGMDRISRVGMALEEAAEARDEDEVRRRIGELRDFLSRVEVRSG
jgi:HPt (histidine-containing phosphotransfer) domain-containing protein